MLQDPEDLNYRKNSNYESKEKKIIDATNIETNFIQKLDKEFLLFSIKKMFLRFLDLSSSKEEEKKYIKLNLKQIRLSTSKEKSHDIKQLFHIESILLNISSRISLSLANMNVEKKKDEFVFTLDSVELKHQVLGNSNLVLKIPSKNVNRFPASLSLTINFKIFQEKISKIIITVPPIKLSIFIEFIENLLQVIKSFITFSNHEQNKFLLNLKKNVFYENYQNILKESDTILSELFYKDNFLNSKQKHSKKLHSEITVNVEKFKIVLYQNDNVNLFDFFSLAETIFLYSLSLLLKFTIFIQIFFETLLK